MTRKEMFEQAKSYYSKEEYNKLIKERRQTGKSLGKALYIVSIAMKKPGTPIKISDYDPFYQVTIRQAKYITIPHLKRIIKDLHLEGFTFNTANMTLTYHLPWEEL